MQLFCYFIDISEEKRHLSDVLQLLSPVGEQLLLLI